MNCKCGCFGACDERKLHAHRCDDCAEDFECDGTLEKNLDGEPKVICRLYHVWAERLCPICRATAEVKA